MLLVEVGEVEDLPQGAVEVEEERRQVEQEEEVWGHLEVLV